MDAPPSSMSVLGGGVVIWGDFSRGHTGNNFSITDADLPVVGVQQENGGWCGGTLLADGWYVVTAAHCVTISARTGLIVRSDFKVAGPTNRIAIGVPYSLAASVVVHPHYSGPVTLRNDIALIRLSARLDNPHPLPLPSYQGSFLSAAENRPIVNSYGFGILPSVQNPDGSLYQDNYLRYASFLVEYCPISLPGHFCSDVSSIPQLCAGDSGGPVTIYDARGIEILVGVNSFSANDDARAGKDVRCGEDGNYSGFVDVGYYLAWIQATIATR